MISRRNIRVKVMQTLYTVSSIESENGKEAKKNLDSRKILLTHFEQTRQLFIYLTYFLTEVCRYAEKDAHQRAGKHLPSYDDLHVNTKLAGNKILLKILEDPAYTDLIKKIKPESVIGEENIPEPY
jgi:N utilization substance protein B